MTAQELAFLNCVNCLVFSCAFYTDSLPLLVAKASYSYITSRLWNGTMSEIAPFFPEMPYFSASEKNLFLLVHHFK